MIGHLEQLFFNEKLNGTKISCIIKSYIKNSHGILTFHRTNFYTLVKSKIKRLRYDIYIKTFDMKTFIFLTKPTHLWELPIFPCLYIKAYAWGCPFSKYFQILHIFAPFLLFFWKIARMPFFSRIGAVYAVKYCIIHKSRLSCQYSSLEKRVKLI